MRPSARHGARQCCTSLPFNLTRHRPYHRPCLRHFPTHAKLKCTDFSDFPDASEVRTWARYVAVSPTRIPGIKSGFLRSPILKDRDPAAFSRPDPKYATPRKSSNHRQTANLIIPERMASGADGAIPENLRSAHGVAHLVAAVSEHRTLRLCNAGGTRGLGMSMEKPLALRSMASIPLSKRF